jgi:hypothetical protein
MKYQRRIGCLTMTFSNQWCWNGSTTKTENVGRKRTFLTMADEDLDDYHLNKMKRKKRVKIKKKNRVKVKWRAENISKKKEEEVEEESG